MEDDLELKFRLLDFVQSVTDAMGLDLTGTVQETPDGPRVNLDGEDGNVLIRQKGEALQALQHLASTVFRPELPDNKRLVVDCLGFRRDKDVELRQMALFLGEKARRTGVDQQLGPLNAYERRIVHMAVAEQGLAETESIGDAAVKTVIISPKR
ncbi:MAG TPA: R3H domain-containing nucleic acid-binding protein [Vicinamibacterales bacterium]|nr:R3H domain-containing nucleic acid-binding protein [Vicinamibacterales bacterium]